MEGTQVSWRWSFDRLIKWGCKLKMKHGRLSQPARPWEAELLDRECGVYGVRANVQRPHGQGCQAWRRFETRGDGNFSVAAWLLSGAFEHLCYLYFRALPMPHFPHKGLV